MANPFQFLQDVRAEAKKITWPSRQETVITTVLVLAMVALASIFFMVVDWALVQTVARLINIGR